MCVLSMYMVYKQQIKFYIKSVRDCYENLNIGFYTLVLPSKLYYTFTVCSTY